MEIMINIYRIMYFLMIILDIGLIAKKIIFHTKKKQNTIYFAGWIFGISLFTSLLINFNLFMSDIISDSWHYLEKDSFIALTVINIINPVITLLVFTGTRIHLEITEASLILHKMFSRKTIKFIDIDTQKSEYVLEQQKSTKLFPKKNILKGKEYLLIYCKNNELIHINMNPFLFNGNMTLAMIIIIKKLKIKRKSIEN